MSSENFNVRWNNYHAVLQSSFPKLLTNEHFVDVTLTCEGRSLRCHKMVLSACSSYFEQLLTESPCQHPIIFLKDMKFWEVEALVDFMYRGEVSVSQDKLASLVQAAESLQIKGLAGSTETQNIVPKLVNERVSTTRTKNDGPPTKRKRVNDRKTLPELTDERKPFPEERTTKPHPEDRTGKPYPEDRKPFPVNLPDLEMIPLPRIPVVTQLQRDDPSDDSSPPMLLNSPADCSSNEAFASVNVKEEFMNDGDAEDGASNEECGGEDDSLDMSMLAQTELNASDDPLMNPGPSGVNAEDRPQVTKSTNLKKGKNRSNILNKGDTISLVEVVYNCESEIAETEEDGLSEVEVVILLTPGPYTTLRYLRRYISVLRGAHLNQIHALFNKLACRGFGACYSVERTLVFFKRPSQLLSESAYNLIEPWVDSYKEAYLRRNTGITVHQDEKLKSVHPFLQDGLWQHMNTGTVGLAPPPLKKEKEILVNF